MFGALHGAVPDRVMAAPGSPLWNMTLIGEEAGARYACVLFFNGGLGGRPQADGVSCLSWPSNISTTPVEVAERAAPLLIRYKRLCPGSGGEGEFRGGLGQETLVELRGAGGGSAFFMTERTSIPAPGLGGGEAGGVGRGADRRHPRRHAPAPPSGTGQHRAAAHARRRRLRPTRHACRCVPSGRRSAGLHQVSKPPAK